MRDLLRGRFLGHPIHVMLVHLPAGLLPAAFLFDLAGLWWADSTAGLHVAAFWCMAAGVAGGLAAAVFGFRDLLQLADPQRELTALWHGMMEFTVILLFGLLAGLRWQEWPVLQVPELWEIVAEGMGVALMGAANFKGGELVHGKRG